MTEETGYLLGEEIKAEINELSTLKTGSKEKSTAIDDLAKLYKLKIEETKNEMDYNEKYDKRSMEDAHHCDDREREEELRRIQLSEQAKDRYLRVGIDLAGIILPLIFYASWMKKGFKFEEDGTFTSTTFRSLIQKFKPTRK